jgi:AraC-like DNA-binding protein/mannose-6-phosphate isomerase-like protein (cupin superfamily)
VEAALDEARIVRVGAGFGTRAEVLRATYRSQSFARHSHETYTLGLVRGGAGSFWCRGAERFVREGDLVVIPPTEVHTGNVGQRAGFLSYLAIYLPVEVAALHLESIGEGKAGTPQVGSLVFQNSIVRSAFAALDRATSKATGGTEAEAEAAATAAISSMLECLTYSGASTGTPATRPARVRPSRVVEIVRQVLEDSFASHSETSLDALAAASGVTPFRVIRAFEAATGMSPHQYLIQLRVERARQSLADGALPSFAALQVGFVDQSHLTHHFKKRFGITPGNYRRCVVTR